jgi:hypothetical protein
MESILLMDKIYVVKDGEITEIRDVEITANEDEVKEEEIALEETVVEEEVEERHDRGERWL